MVILDSSFLMIIQLIIFHWRSLLFLLAQVYFRSAIKNFRLLSQIFYFQMYWFLHKLDENVVLVLLPRFVDVMSKLFVMG